MLWEHQKKLAEEALTVLERYKIVYLDMQVRTGKTLTSLYLAQMSLKNRVLFVTTKDVIPDIKKAYLDEGFDFNLTVTNYEQLKNYPGEGNFDLIICDEAHLLKAFPKPSIRTRFLKSIVGWTPLVLMSGTPHPESFSDLFHQFWISRHNPFKIDNFYKWAKEFVDIKKKRVAQGHEINDYSHAKADKIMAVLEPYFVRYTQQEAGFIKHETIEEIVTVPANPKIFQLAARLERDLIYTFKDGAELVCDSAVKMQCAYHQIFSGTIKIGKEHRVLVTDKAEFIKYKYQGKKIAIFYKYIGEKLAIEKVFGKLNLTQDSREFQTRDDKIFYVQIKKGSRGITLSTADILVFYNIDFSYEQYVQATQRHKVRDREKEPLVHWIFTERGIENFIYNRVQQKKDFNVGSFLRSYKIDRKKFKLDKSGIEGAIGIGNPGENTQVA